MKTKSVGTRVGGAGTQVPTGPEEGGRFHGAGVIDIQYVSYGVRALGTELGSLEEHCELLSPVCLSTLLLTS